MKRKPIKYKKIFDGVIGCKVSVLFDHFRYGKKLKESYYGEVLGRKDGFLIVKPDDLSFATKKKVDIVLLREDQILSFWIYKND